MATALGIIAYNDSSVYVRGIEKFRPIAGFSYVGRYRLVDIPISNMANSGINDIEVYTNRDPKILFDHIGGGRHYNINNKHGHVGIVPVFGDGQRVEYITDIDSYYRNLHSIEDDPNPYVVIAPVNFVYKINFADLLTQHIDSGADVTMLYHDIHDADEHMNYCKILDINRQKGVKKIATNMGRDKDVHASLETYIMSKKTFIHIVKKAHEYSAMYWLVDMLNEMVGDLDIRAVEYKGPVFPIYDLKSYFNANMEMLSEKNMSFFADPNWPIYTRTNDSAPTIYKGKGSSQGALISNGCTIEGEVTNSIVGRGVVVEKGAFIDHCLILPGALIGADAHLSHVIVDKNAQIIHKKDIAGYMDDPLYISRREIV